MAPALAQEKFYTIDDIYSLQEGSRAELIDGQIYYMAPPSRKHQDILSFLHLAIGNHIANNNGECKVYPAPFAVWVIEIVSSGSRPMDYYTKLSLYRSAGVREYWIVDPMKQTVLVYDMEHDSAPAIYSFTDSIKANIYDDLWIDFRKLNL